ncbi:HEPN domain-containing protein [Oribacterium sp. P6A1]|uniref:HEPN domain-containing protein n=1 Tax=Oribacterium sp. P6A1 TaxID=1410612 RepID=UPI000568D7EC|nr:HEPN domain-containing protein [Oribacterium sp. P6A1]
MKVFKQRITALKQGLSSTNAEYVEKTLMANSNKFVTLESRLADLLYAEGNIYFDTGDIKQDDFPAVIARTRNYYIHYDENIKNKYKILTIDELNIYKNVLFQILEYYILYELGFSVENRSKKIRDRWGSVSNDLQILKASRNKYTQ